MAKGLTLLQVGALFDTSKQTVGHWETGKNMPSAEQVARMAEEFNASVEWLLFGRNLPALSPELLTRLGALDTERLRQLENGLRGQLEMSPLPKPPSGKQRALAA